MKKAIYAIAAILMLVSVFADSGSIWDTDMPCSDNEINQYNIGDIVYVHGHGFDPDTDYEWTVEGQPGEASCKPTVVVASGTLTSDEFGDICELAYVIQQDDCGVYKITVGQKHDTFSVDEGEPIPEFGVVAGGIAAVAAIAGMIVFRKK